MRLDGLKLFSSGRAFVPRLQCDYEESVVAGANETEQAEADDAGRIFHPRSACQNVFDLGRGLRCPLPRGAVGQMQVDICIALIFIGQETPRYAGAKESGCDAEGQQEHNYYGSFPEQDAAPPYIAVGGALENTVKPIEESPQQPVALLLRTKQ